MIKLTKLPPLENPTQRMTQLFDQVLDPSLLATSAGSVDEGDFIWQISPEGLRFNIKSQSAHRDLRLYWLAAVADFYQKKNFFAHALFQLGAREIESYLRDANHLAAFEVEDVHEEFHRQLQHSLAAHLTSSVLQQSDLSADFPPTYVEQAAWLEQRLSLPLQHFFKQALTLEWVYYGMKDAQWSMVWNFQWSGPSLLWTHSTKAAFQNGFLQAGHDFCREHSMLSELKWVAELDQLP